MSKMKYSRARLLKSRGFYAACIIGLLAFGAAAFFGLGMPRIYGDATADAASSSTVTYQPQIDLSYPEVPDNTSSSEKPKKPSSSSTVSIFKPSEVTEVVTPSANFFVMPLTGEIIKPYSDTELQYSLTLGDWRLHKAVDIKGVTGDRINAAGDGTVTAVYSDALYGLTVEINHGNDVVATYSGLETATVKVGNVVGVNMEIGTLGKIPCECVETTHLHFSVKIGDKTVSPLNIIGVDN